MIPRVWQFRLRDSARPLIKGTGALPVIHRDMRAVASAERRRREPARAISPTRFESTCSVCACWMVDKLLPIGFCDNSVREKDRRCRASHSGEIARPSAAAAGGLTSPAFHACGSAHVTVDECPCAFYQWPRAAAIATRVVSLAAASRLPFLLLSGVAFLPKQFVYMC